MCGIAGIIYFNNCRVASETIEQMTRAMKHRGPDAESYFIDSEVALGHRRLSIIDLSDAANQPFTDNSERYVIVFNGEIYNYKELKRLLPDYEFKTNGDTEVILAAYIRWGPECVHRFKGMFAFAIWDKQERELLIMRDRLGVKPLYYYADENQFVFASELRSIMNAGIVKRQINIAGMIEYFSYQSIGYPLSPVENIHQLKAGSWISIKNGILHKKQYWSLANNNVDFDFTNKKNTHEKIKELLTRSVERRLVSDVPVGAFLSGGIDSSAMVGLMAEVSNSKVSTFTIAFDEKEFNESEYANIIAKKFNTDHTNISFDPSILLDELENALNAMDTPSGDGINTYVVSKAIRETGIKVALSGIGGDELFAGYPLFSQYLQLQHRNSLYRRTGGLRKFAASLLSINSSSKIQRVQQIIKAPSTSIENIYPIFRQILSPQILKELLVFPPGQKYKTAFELALNEEKGCIEKLPLLSQVSVAEYMGYTQNTLLKDTDQMSMALSLEVREPFFDHELVEFVLAVPDSLKRTFYPKGLLVESLHPLLPDAIVRRKKQGFLFPWQLWMRNELRSFCEKRIKNLSQRPFINGDKLIKYWKLFLNNDTSVRWAELWLFVVLEYWMEKNDVN